MAGQLVGDDLAGYGSQSEVVVFVFVFVQDGHGVLSNILNKYFLFGSGG
jgi:hypothetical protein